MTNLSKIGIKIILPIILNGIKANNWRTKVASI